MKRVFASALALMVVVSGCSLVRGGKINPLPAARGATYRVTVVFDDVLDLVPEAAVKVDDVTVGNVTSVKLDGFQARVTLRVKKDVDLPADAVATLRQTSLLGEKFVELARPAGGGTGRLEDGAEIPASRSARNPEVEEVFTALSALLSGGGLTELQTIAVELSKALAGREEQVRGALRRIDKLVTTMDSRKTEIVRAIDALDRLTTTFAAQRQTIASALDEFTPALTVLADQRGELTKLLTKVARLGQVGTRVIAASKADTIANLAMLAPILDEIISVKTDLAATIDQLVQLTAVLPKDIPGDYLQLLVTVFVSPSTLPVDSAHPPVAPSRKPVVPALPGPRGLGDLLSGGVR